MIKAYYSIFILFQMFQLEDKNTNQEDRNMSNVLISKGFRKDIPSEAILLSSKDVVQIHWKTIKDWKPRHDV